MAYVGYIDINPNEEGKRWSADRFASRIRGRERTLCRLKHRELLDAAHIIPDHMPERKSTIENGLWLCKLHHSACDAFIIGVTPDYVIQVRADILEEEDGPVLQHGLKGLHNGDLTLISVIDRRVRLPLSQGRGYGFDFFSA